MRHLAYCPSFSRLQYSTQSLISSAVPVPALVQMYGSHPSFRQKRTYSSVPKVLGSSTRQALSKKGLRSGPTASFQW